MAFANTSVTDVLAAGIEARGKKFRDNVTGSNALLMRLNQKGNVRTFDGGHLIREEIMHAESSSAGWYSGYEQLTVGASDMLSAAEFDIKQLAVAVTISGREKLQNSGAAGLIDLMGSRVKAAEATMKNYLSAGLYSDGTGSGGKVLTGLAAAVPTDPTTGTYGGINRATASNAFWKSGLRDNTAAAATIQADMNRLYAETSRGADHVDLISAGNTAWGFFVASLQAIQRISDPKLAEAGFTTLKFMGADVVLDGGIGGDLTPTDMIFLNTNYIHLRPHADCNMVPLKPSNRTPYNQDAEAVILAWAGNLTCSGAQFQGRYWAD